MRIHYKPNQYSQQRQHEKKRWIWPVVMAMEATKRRDDGHEVYWDEELRGADEVITEREGLSFMSLPIPDRLLTKAFDKKYQRNGNFKHTPGTYIQSASGCWWGNCTFCKEKGEYYHLRSVDEVTKEIKECKELGFKEIFDDAASLAGGMWREAFIWELRQIDITFSCNMRFATNPDFKAMKEAGFRMLLYGLESANQPTLQKIAKGTFIKDVICELKRASAAGLEPHIAVMFGYPWETDYEAIKTLELVHYLLRKGYAKTAQASVYTVEGEVPSVGCQTYVKQIYNAAYSVEFWMNKIRDIRGADDIKYIWRGIQSCFGI